MPVILYNFYYRSIFLQQVTLSEYMIYLKENVFLKSRTIYNQHMPIGKEREGKEEKYIKCLEVNFTTDDWRLKYM